jgi:hypothetical protein
VYDDSGREYCTRGTETENFSLHLLTWFFVMSLVNYKDHYVVHNPNRNQQDKRLQEVLQA